MPRLLPLILVLPLLLAGPALAVDEDLEEILEKIVAGRYRSASGDLEERLAEDPADGAARLARARIFFETGRYDEARKDLDALRGPKGEHRPAAEAMLLDLLLVRGGADEALSLAEKILEERPTDIHAAFARGRALRMRGRRAEAREVFRGLMKAYNERRIDDPRERLDIAVATIHLAELVEDSEVDLSPTMRLLDRLTLDDPDFVDAYVVKGDLLVKWQKDVDARKEYRKALKVNGKHAGALRGMAESYAFRMNLGRAMRYVKRAAETNPNLEAILCFQAGMKVADYEYEAARGILEKVLKINPNSGEARSLLGAAAFVTGDRAAFEAEAKTVLRFDPTYGAYYHTLAQILESHRRFEEAAEWAKKATEIDPRDWGAAFTLGRNLLNVGLDEKAYEVLDEAEKNDPYPHIWRANYLELFDAALGKFIETETEHFKIKIHAKESRALRKLVGDFMERSYETLGEKYGYEVEPPVVVEVFHVHADFAARTIGMPGLGALGACFGRVITLDSPSARQPGTFAWAATAWHEFAHSVTLGLSRGRVPRWFTEGLSVFEERRLGDHYQRRMERELFDAYHNGKIPPIAKFNAEFRGPRVLFAYYLGGLMCEYLVEKHGFEKIPVMLRLYGEEKRDSQVFREALGISLADFDAGFRGWVERHIGSWKLRPRWDDDMLRKNQIAAARNPKDFDALITVAEGFLQRGNTIDAGHALAKARRLRADDPRVWLVQGHLARRSKNDPKAMGFFEKALAHPDGEDHDARLVMARLAAKRGEFAEAVETYEIAKRGFPYAVGNGNPYLALAEIHKEQGDTDAMVAEYEAYVGLVETDIPIRVLLAEWAEETGDLAKAARYLDEVLMIYPMNAGFNLRYARVLRQLKRWDRAAMLYTMTLELAPKHPDAANVYAEFAEVEYMRGRHKDARIHANHALELSPGHAGAEAVLEKMK